MPKPPVNVVTELPESPDREHRSRVVKYGITMGLRTVCVILCFALSVWLPHTFWWVIPTLGAVVLPYFAVVVANAAGPGNRSTVERPGGIQLFVHRDENEG